MFGRILFEEHCNNVYHFLILFCLSQLYEFFYAELSSDYARNTHSNLLDCDTSCGGIALDQFLPLARASVNSKLNNTKTTPMMKLSIISVWLFDEPNRSRTEPLTKKPRTVIPEPIKSKQALGTKRWRMLMKLPVDRCVCV